MAYLYFLCYSINLLCSDHVAEVLQLNPLSDSGYQFSVCADLVQHSVL